ncbi:hypothetical protein GJ496_006225 [Pomphorhynchus laevis]|nr:hypothetical protein GJ496_006225 [Pomphorhynchus laevis]
MSSSNSLPKSLVVKTNRRLPELAIQQMNNWYQQHLSYPYPSDIEKEQLAQHCGISVVQVKSWFANKRNRSRSRFITLQARASRISSYNIPNGQIDANPAVYYANRSVKNLPEDSNPLHPTTIGYKKQLPSSLYRIQSQSASPCIVKNQLHMKSPYNPQRTMHCYNNSDCFTTYCRTESHHRDVRYILHHCEDPALQANSHVLLSPYQCSLNSQPCWCNNHCYNKLTSTPHSALFQQTLGGERDQPECMPVVFDRFFNTNNHCHEHCRTSVADGSVDNSFMNHEGAHFQI